MQRSTLSKRQLERKVQMLQELIALIVFKYHKGTLSVSAKEMSENLPLVNEFHILVKNNVCEIVSKQEEIVKTTMEEPKNVSAD